MSVSDLVLVIVSGLGVIHGLFLSVFLWIYNQGHKLSNQLLSLLLIVLSFRIGKSVFLEFMEHMDIKMIFAGLATIMLIGPLFYFFVHSCIHKNLQLAHRKWVQFTPAFFGIGFGLWLDESNLEFIPNWLLATIMLSYYLHFIIYLIISYRKIRNEKLNLTIEVYRLLMLVLNALLAIWVVYFLNLIDEIVPYIVGPLLYSIIAYVVSFEIIRKGYVGKIGQNKYKTTAASGEQIERTFEKALKIVVEGKAYKNPEITLKSLSEQIHVSQQVLSMVINKMSGINFNNFINTYRIEEASHLLQRKDHDHLTIAAIAFEVGFNSISSFNTAFKKQTKKTPQAYRRQFTE